MPSTPRRSKMTNVNAEKQRQQINEPRGKYGLTARQRSHQQELHRRRGTASRRKKSTKKSYSKEEGRAFVARHARKPSSGGN